MSLILRQVIGYQQGRRASSLTTPDPKLEQELKETKKDLNLILNKWKFGDTPITSAKEFLNNFEPWIKRQLEQQKEVKEFLKLHKLKNLSEIKTINTSDNEQLKFYKENIKLKEEIIEDYKKAEKDYLKKIEQLEKKLTK